MRRFLAVFIVLAVAAIWLWGCQASRPADTSPLEPTPTATDSLAGADQSRGTPTPAPSPKSEGQVATPTPLNEEEPMTPQPGQGTPEASLPHEARRLVQMAKEDLARSLELCVSEISVMSAEAVDWSDTSLGCPQPGEMYAQVITPGFLIVLEATGQTYEYHTDRVDQVVLCETTTDSQIGPDPSVIDGHPWMPRDTDIEPTWPRK